MPSYSERLADGFALINGSEYGPILHEQKSDLATILRVDQIFNSYPSFDDGISLGEQVGFEWTETPP